MATRISLCHLASFLVFLAFIPEGLCFSSSVPPTRSVCRDMKPGHQQHKIRTDVPPYSVSPNIKSVVGGEDVVDRPFYGITPQFTLVNRLFKKENLNTPETVTLSGDENNRFLGFYVQARDDKGNAVGTFTPSDDAKVHNCAGIRNNAAHHADGKMEKTSVKVTWKAPKSFQGPIVFLATFVKEYDTFWTKIKATEVVTVTENGS